MALGLIALLCLLCIQSLCMMPSFDLRDARCVQHAKLTPDACPGAGRVGEAGAEDGVAGHEQPAAAAAGAGAGGRAGQRAAALGRRRRQQLAHGEAAHHHRLGPAPGLRAGLFWETLRGLLKCTHYRRAAVSLCESEARFPKACPIVRILQGYFLHSCLMSWRLPFLWGEANCLVHAQSATGLDGESITGDYISSIVGVRIATPLFGTGFNFCIGEPPAR